MENSAVRKLKQPPGVTRSKSIDLYRHSRVKRYSTFSVRGIVPNSSVPYFF